MRLGETAAGELASTDQRVAAACAATAGIFGQGWVMFVGQPAGLLGIAVFAVLAVPGWYLSTLGWRMVLRARGREPSKVESWVFGSAIGIVRARLLVIMLRVVVLLLRGLLCAVLALPAIAVCLVLAAQPWRWRRTCARNVSRTSDPSTVVRPHGNGSE